MKEVSILEPYHFEIYEKKKTLRYITLEDFINKVREQSGKADHETFVWLDMDHGYYDEAGSPEFHIGVIDD